MLGDASHQVAFAFEGLIKLRLLVFEAGDVEVEFGRGDAEHEQQDGADGDVDGGPDGGVTEGLREEDVERRCAGHGGIKARAL